MILSFIDFHVNISVKPRWLAGLGVVDVRDFSLIWDKLRRTRDNEAVEKRRMQTGWGWCWTYPRHRGMQNSEKAVGSFDDGMTCDWYIDSKQNLSVIIGSDCDEIAKSGRREKRQTACAGKGRIYRRATRENESAVAGGRTYGTASSGAEMGWSMGVFAWGRRRHRQDSADILSLQICRSDTTNIAINPRAYLSTSATVAEIHARLTSLSRQQ